MSRSSWLLLALAPLALLAGGCCRCPKPCAVAAGPAPASGSLLLPEKLGPPVRPAPASLEDWLIAERLPHSGFARFKEALGPYLGARVRWTLRSWGGEIGRASCRERVLCVV